MRITRLVSPSGDPERVHAELDNGEKLRVDTYLVAEYGLYAGRELSEEAYAELAAAANKRQTRKRALRMTGARAMSHKEITDRLVRRGGTQEDAEDAADWLEKLGVVDDAAYAGMIVRHYASRGYGPAKAKQELFRRGIPKELWEDALAELPDEEEAIGRLLAARVKGVPDRDQARKLADFLQRRGFGHEKIRAVLERYLEDMGEDL